MKYYVIAGEASGDVHGANLMKEIHLQDPNAVFRFWGGDLMAKVYNATQVEHYKNTAFMGFVEVLKHLPKIAGLLKKCQNDIENYQPDAVILIDYPGFNLRIAKFTHKKGLKTIYYISPQVWAWKENRVKTIKKVVDLMLVILPFEKAFYKKWNYDVKFVGHPLLDEIEDKDYNFDLKIDKPIIALLPGSREQEVKTILPQIIKIESEFPNYQFIVAGVQHIPDKVYNKILKESNIKVIKGNTYGLLSHSKGALIASGTATLETSMLNVPSAVVYKGNWLSYYIGKLLIKVPYISLVNLVLERKALDELIQKDLNKKQLKAALAKILDFKNQNYFNEVFTQLNGRLGKKGASKRAAQEIKRYLKN